MLIDPPFRNLRQTSHKSSPPKSCSAVITKPPEIIAIFHIPTELPHLPSVFAIFDSHPRSAKGATGASIIFFPSLQSASSYLSELFAVDPKLLSSSGLHWQAQLLAQYAAHVFVARTVYGEKPELRATYHANMEVLEMRMRLNEAEGKIRSLTVEKTGLEAEILRLKTLAARPRSPQSVGNPSSMNAVTNGRSSFSPNRVSSSAVPSSSRLKLDPGKAVDKQKEARPSSPKIAQSITDGKRPQHADLEFATRLQHEELADEHNQMIALQLQKQLEAENRALEEQHQELQKFTQVVFECPICFDKHPQDDITRIDGCGHNLCRGCAKGYLTAKLTEHRFPIICPLCHVHNNTKSPGREISPEVLLHHIIDLFISIYRHQRVLS